MVLLVLSYWLRLIFNGRLKGWIFVLFKCLWVIWMVGLFGMGGKGYGFLCVGLFVLDVIFL